MDVLKEYHHLHDVIEVSQCVLIAVAVHKLQNIMLWEGVHKGRSEFVICQGRFKVSFKVGRHGNVKLELLEEIEWSWIVFYTIGRGSRR